MQTNHKERGQTVDKENKPKAATYPISQLEITSAHTKTFKSGKTGFFGKGVDPVTGDRFQIIGAVKLS